MTENSHIVIIPDSTKSGQGNSTETLRDPAVITPDPANLMNVATLHSCSLCWRHADFHYEHPLIETIHLCKLCQRSMTPLGFLALLRRGMPGNESLHAQIWIARHQEANQDEKGRVA